MQMLTFVLDFHLGALKHLDFSGRTVCDHYTKCVNQKSEHDKARITKLFTLIFYYFNTISVK